MVFPVIPHHIDEERANEVAYVAIILGFVLILPQILKIFLTQSADDISIFSWLGAVVLSLVWLVYGIARRLTPIVISSIVHFIIDIVMVYGIFLYGSFKLFDFLP